MRKDISFALAAGCASLVAYLATLCPTVYVVGSGELITSVYKLGVAHPTGYPLYCLVAHIFSSLPLGEVARRVNLFSALATSASVGWTYLLVRALGANPFVSLAGSLLWAFSGTFWSQAVIAEVYSFLFLLLSVSLWAFLRWRSGDGERFLLLGAYLYGLALSHHLMAVLFGPGVAWFLWRERRRLGEVRTSAWALGLFLLGITTYLYLPLRSRLGPSFVWTPIRNLSDLIHHISGGEYGPRMFSFPLPMILDNLLGYAELLWKDLGPGLVLLPLGIWVLHRDLGLSGLLGVAWTLDVAFGANYDVSDVQVFFLPSLFVVFLVTAVGLAWVWDKLRPKVSAVLASSFLPLWSFSSHLYTNDLHENRIAERFGMDVLENLAPKALLLTRGDDMAFILLYLQKLRGLRPDVTLVSRNSRAMSEPYGPDYRWLSPKDKAFRRRWKELRWLSEGRRPVYYEVEADVPRVRGVKVLPEGLVFRALREWEEAPDPLDFWRRCDPDSLEDLPFYKDIWVRKILSDYRLAQGRAYLAVGDTLRAKECFRRMAELVPDSRTVQHNAGVLFYLLGDWSEAKGYLLRAVRLDMRDAGTYFLLGRTCERSGELQEALEWYGKAARWGFPEDRVLSSFGVVYAKMGKYEEARRFWRNALELNPKNVEAFRNLSGR